MLAEPNPRGRVTIRRWRRAASVGAVLAAAIAPSASAAPTLPPPKFGRSVDIGLVSGIVIVNPRGGGSFRLGAQDRTIPVGSEIDTSKGEVDLRSARDPRQAVANRSAPKPVQDGQFRGAVFMVLQRTSQQGLTVLDMVTTSKMRQRCRIGATAASSPGHLSKRVLQTLRARDASGSFRTRGRYSSATVRGTIWDTAERCDGTLTVVHRGTVDVYDFGARKTIVVHAGHSYLAKVPG